VTSREIHLSAGTIAYEDTGGDGPALIPLDQPGRLTDGIRGFVEATGGHRHAGAIPR
jgi:hypothetical protein